ncbi:hypothetical protein ACF046_01455 [Glutamicibacter creatinolyticus]|uniref:hypothetical protein n=1 Tax=Glutamicibacter creatinolyticus TaxID=162496 RepID=UPI0033EDD9B1
MMIHVLIPKSWDEGYDDRLILRLKNSVTHDSHSISLRYGIKTIVKKNRLPSGEFKNLVIWVDRVVDGMANPITERVKPINLKNIKRLAAVIFNDNLIEDESTPELLDANFYIEACRWVNTLESQEETSRLARGIINRVSQLGSAPTSVLSRIFATLETQINIDDGTLIIDQIAFLFFIARIDNIKNLADVQSFDDVLTHMKKFESLPSVKLLTELLDSHIVGHKDDDLKRSRIMEEVEDGFQVQQDLLKGVYTYGLPGQIGVSIPEIELLASAGKSPADAPTIVYSADPNYLMAYAPRLIFYMSVMTELRYHLHIVAPKDVAVAASKSFMNFVHATFALRNVEMDSIYLEISWSECPESIKLQASYAASARYLIAPQIMERHDSSVWIQDVDLYPIGDIRRFIDILETNHINLFKSHFLNGLLPWVRFLAGNVYVRNTAIGNKFLTDASVYLQNFLNHEHSWMIDQNALTFAIGKVPASIVIGDTRQLNIPVAQSNLSSLIEK